jgi:hypothetical protein
MGLASMPPDRRSPTAVPVTPPMNPHWMVTWAKASFRVLPDCLVLTASTSPSTPSPIPTSISVVRGYGGQVWGSDEQWDLGACHLAP